MHRRSIRATALALLVGNTDTACVDTACCKRHPGACRTREFEQNAKAYSRRKSFDESSIDAAPITTSAASSGWRTIGDDAALQEVASNQCCAGNATTMALAVDGIAKMHSHGMVKFERRVRTVELGMAALAVPGDYVELGTNAGGTAVLMLATLRDFDKKNRLFFAADSFQGLPTPTSEDAINISAHRHWRKGQHRTSLTSFNNNMKRNGMYLGGTHERLRILEGWFHETLPTAGIKDISFLRLDGDLYASTMDGLVMLYHKVVPGGLVYVDDYMAPGCRRAVHEFREKHGITTRMIPIWQGEEATYGLLQPDGSFSNASRLYEAVWWQKRG